MPSRKEPALPPAASLWTLDDVAAHLGCHKESVRRMIARGELRAYRYGRSIIRVDPRDLDRARRPVGAAR